MARKMLQFVSTSAQMPEKREAAKRKLDFDEIYDRFRQQNAETQASRCSQCGVPFCQIHCPLGNNIPDWLNLAAQDRLQEAYQISSATNTFPEICGRICPQDRLCEGNCVLEQSEHEAVTIGSIEKYITDTAFENGWVTIPKAAEQRPEKIGVIGSGPAGLAAAENLVRHGYQVHVYDRSDRAGGLLMYGIPGFKLEKHVVERRIALLADAGVVFHLSVDIGTDMSFEDFKADHDAVLIATGVYKARDIQVPGVGLGNVIPALSYLTTSNRLNLGDSVPEYEDGSLNAQGKDIVVIGGGDTAMDCVRTAIRQGANSVKCLYRRNKANMPGSAREVMNAEEEGVEFVWLTAPEAFIEKDKSGTVGAVRAVRMRLGTPDASGRQSPEIIPDSSHEIKADIVIKALGYDAEDLPTAFKCKDLPVSKWGTVEVNQRTLMTEMDGVFAAGDIVRGASLVVWAIKDGREAADSIQAYLEYKKSQQSAAD